MAKAMRCAALLAVFAVCRAEEDLAPEEATDAPTKAPVTRPPLPAGATHPPTSPPSISEVTQAQAEAAVNALVAANFAVTTASGVTLQIEEASTAVAPNGNVAVTMKFQGSVATFDATAQAAAKNRLASDLNVDAARIVITSIRDGSVIIQFTISNGVPAPPYVFPRQGGDDGLSDGAIAGIVIGTVLGGGAIIFVIVYFLCCQDEKSNAPEDTKAGAQSAPYGEGADNKVENQGETEMQQPTAVDDANPKPEDSQV